MAPPEGGFQRALTFGAGLGWREARIENKKAGGLSTASPRFLPGGLLGNPAERFGGDECQRQEVIAPEGIGGFPLLTVFVTALERGVEARPFVGVVFPDGGTNSVEADFMRGFVCVWRIWFYSCLSF